MRHRPASHAEDARIAARKLLAREFRVPRGNWFKVHPLGGCGCPWCRCCYGHKWRARPLTAQEQHAEELWREWKLEY